MPPHAVLSRAHELYLLDGEVLERGGKAAFRPLRPQAPRLPGTMLWLTIRTDTLDWPDEAMALVLRHLERWRDAGNSVTGVQIDFDAKASGLANYAAFLRELRERLPARTKLSVTGLMDWSANGDPQALGDLKGVIDEVAIQTYQARETIPEYEAYLRRLQGMPVPFRIGLVEGGKWREPGELHRMPMFRGYVVFLLPRDS